MAGFHPGFGAEIFQVDPHTVLPNHALYERRRRVASESLYHHVHGLKRGWLLGPVHDAPALYGLLSSLRVDRGLDPCKAVPIVDPEPHAMAFGNGRQLFALAPTQD